LPPDVRCASQGKIWDPISRTCVAYGGNVGVILQQADVDRTITGVCPQGTFEVILYGRPHCVPIAILQFLLDPAHFQQLQAEESTCIIGPDGVQISVRLNSEQKPHSADDDERESPSSPSNPSGGAPPDDPSSLRNRLTRLRPANAVHDINYTISRHTIRGQQVQRDLARGREAHIFNEGVDLAALEQRVWEQGRSMGQVGQGQRGTWQRFIWESPSPIGRRIQNGRSDVPLRFVEIKYNPSTGLYHLVPRARPAG
jgi:hypothetical protein